MSVLLLYEIERMNCCYLEGALAMVASKTSLVIDFVISSKLINQVYRLLTRLTLLCCPCKTRHISWIFHTQQIPKKAKTSSNTYKVFDAEKQARLCLLTTTIFSLFQIKSIEITAQKYSVTLVEP